MMLVKSVSGNGTCEATLLYKTVKILYREGGKVLLFVLVHHC